MNNLNVNQSVAGGEAMRILSIIAAEGYVAYLAGGCVRDHLIGEIPKDYDIATNATPPEIRRIFGRQSTLAIGESFGVIGVLPPRKPQTDRKHLATDQASVRAKRVPTEVATFRSDGTYSDGRRPDDVQFGDAEADAARRDFTINGLFYDPVAERVVDFVGGLDDLRDGRLRTIGDPRDRFAEDQLRMLRAIRFATTKSVTIDDATLDAIQRNAAAIKNVSPERIGQEMRRTLGHHRAAEGLTMLIESGLAESVWPELDARMIAAAERLISPENLPSNPPAISPAGESFVDALAICLHVAGDWRDQIKSLTSRWRLSNDERDRVQFAVASLSILQSADQTPWHRVQPILVDRYRDHAVTLACLTANQSAIDVINNALTIAPERLDPPPLITGKDLHAIGVEPGPAFRDILQSIRDAQLDGKIQTRQEAIEIASR